MPRKSGGFTLIELLIVVVIMALLVGATGSLLAGFYNMFDTTTDSATARRRANDVFNILKMPILNAGLGMPGTKLGSYFKAGESIAGSGNPLVDWERPVEFVPADTRVRVEGNALKVVYALPTGRKNGTKPITAFESQPSANGQETSAALNAVPITAPVRESFISADLATRIVEGEPDVRAFVVFPGMDMYPMFVKDKGDDVLNLVGRVPPKKDNDTFKNIIRRYHDIYAVRAGVACVVADGASSSFYLLDVCTEDPLEEGTLDEDLSGFRVEGIRAVSFDVDPEYRSITVWVLAEGDVARSGRNTDAATAQRIRDRWEPLIAPDRLNDQIYYEDFRMTWRMRNVQGR